MPIQAGGTPEGSMCTKCGKIYAGPHKNEYASEHERQHTHQYKGHNYSGGLCRECAPSTDTLRRELAEYHRRRARAQQEAHEHGV